MCHSIPAHTVCVKNTQSHRLMHSHSEWGPLCLTKVSMWVRMGVNVFTKTEREMHSWYLSPFLINIQSSCMTAQLANQIAHSAGRCLKSTAVCGVLEAQPRAVCTTEPAPVNLQTPARLLRSQRWVSSKSIYRTSCNCAPSWIKSRSNPGSNFEALSEWTWHNFNSSGPWDLKTACTESSVTSSKRCKKLF